jgi:hypothetical protein
MGQEPASEIPFTQTHTHTHTQTHTSRAFQAWIWVRTLLEKFLSVVGKACGWGPYEKRVPHTSRAFRGCISVKNQLVEFISVVGKACAWGPYQHKGNTWGSGPGGVAFWLRTATSKVVVHSSLVRLRVLPKAASAKVVLLHSGYGLVQSIKQLLPPVINL